MTIIDEARSVIVHEGAGPLPDGVLRLLDAWLPARRWYPVPGDGVRHVPWLTVELAGGTADAEGRGPGRAPGVVVPLLRLAGPGLAGDEGALVVQVPLVLERVRAPTDARTAIGVVDTGDGYLAVHDGGTHPAAWRAYLEAALPADFPAPAGRPVTRAATAPTRSPARAADVDPPPDQEEPGWLEGARALGGEQSNTSVLVPGLKPPVPGFPGERADGVILKILRTVPAGPHPDVVIPEALTRAGWDGVPRYLGSVELSVPPAAGGPGETPPGPRVPGDGEIHAHLAVVSELVADADDGFELACAHAQEGVDFDESAAELGAVVAHLHTALATARPTDATLDASGFMGVLRRRAAEAIADVPGLAPYRAGITAFYDEVSAHLAGVTADRPVPLQAIHGDLHLGQVLHARSGWKVLDFEGEPQRPVAERTAPDLPLRDVAGLLRSFDYAAAVGEAADPEWSARAQLSFLEGYRQALAEAGSPAGSPQDHGDAVPGAAIPGGSLGVTTASLLLRALTLDKALYEVVYEARHRPAWLHIPLNAVARVLDR
ncbi:phosphotransferase [Myceligenerans xiligouense]|uniref:Maltokinase n=1 Tax=Myceligenerans xiligouense TaxID=253184 RepID=A0A3N4YHE7_9MICO|nr:phosphotransferase [Myceligenerans xiligouense]RPF20213.1 maltokinase [Myceligenerans xiligouense]